MKSCSTWPTIRAMHFAVAKTYADAFNHWFGEWSEDSLWARRSGRIGAEYEERPRPGSTISRRIDCSSSFEPAAVSASTPNERRA